MGELSTEMTGSRSNEENFGFGFNDQDFSDRVLHIEITPANSNGSDCFEGIEVKNLHITSLILAAKSPFFLKLFKNGMKESKTREANLRINASEEKALMDLLNFMYSNTLSATTNSDLLDVVIIADKFEVRCCMRYCIQLLLKMPMSLESASSFLELPPTVLVSEIVLPLIDASKKYLFAHFKDFNNSLEEAMKLSLSALEFVLGSDGLRVDSEDDVYEFILKWVHTHYLKPEERQEIITNRLTKFLCFPHMSCSKLKGVLLCPDFDHEKVSKLVMEALFYKAEVFHASKDLDSTKSNFVGHLYHDRLVKVPQLEFPGPHRVIYFDLKKEECGTQLSYKNLYSQPFLLGGWWFSLSLTRRTKAQSSFIDHFGLYLERRKVSGTCSLEFEVAVMKKSLNKFERRRKEDCILTDEVGWGWSDVFGIPWATFMSDESDYFIDGILHLRVDLTIINPRS